MLSAFVCFVFDEMLFCAGNSFYPVPKRCSVTVVFHEYQYRDQTWFSYINIREGGVENRGRRLRFQHLPRDLANGNALKTHVRSLLLHNN